MASSQIFILRDDALGAGLSLGGGQWIYAPTDYYIGGESIFPGFATAANDSMGSMSVTFQGTSLALTGNTPGNDPTSTSQIFTVTIDDGKPYNTSTDDPHPQTYRQWYQSPLLPSGTHTIAFGHLFGVALDYMVITPGSDTPLTDQTLMVDDYYTGIKYTGSWQASTNQTLTTNTAIGAAPFQNSTHHTTNAGDSLSFSYTGTNASIWGVYPWNIAGSISLSYTIDNSTTFTKTFSSGGPSSDHSGQEPNFMLLDTGPLSAGNHTLNLTLNAAIGQSLMIDYILYNPAFATLAAMPNLTVTTQGGSSSSTSAIISSTTSPSVTGTSPPSQSSPPSNKNNTGAIAGGVVGGVVLLAILAALIFFRSRSRKNTKLSGSQAPAPLNFTGNDNALIIEPFPHPLTPGSQSGLSTSDNYQPSSFSPGFIGSVKGGGSSITLSTSPSQLQAIGSNGQQYSQTRELHNLREGTDVEELRSRIQRLQEQNAELVMTTMAPPPYLSE